MRPTDFCHPIELRAPAPRVFPIRSRHFHGGEAPWRVRLHAALSGDRTFHDARRPLRRIVIQRERLRSLLPHGLEIRTWAFSSHGAEPDRASDIPVATLDFPIGLAFASFIGDIEDRQDHRCHRLVKADAK